MRERPSSEIHSLLTCTTSLVLQDTSPENAAENADAAPTGQAAAEMLVHVVSLTTSLDTSSSPAAASSPPSGVSSGTTGVASAATPMPAHEPSNPASAPMEVPMLPG